MTQSEAIDPATGIPEALRASVCSLLSTDTRVQSILLFGSRAIGTWREGSDIDIAVSGGELDRTDVWNWKSWLDDDVFPWSLDIVVVDDRTDQHLREHIERVGRPLCARPG